MSGILRPVSRPPRGGAWIEILDDSIRFCYANSRPPRGGAWIEISVSGIMYDSAGPRGGRGLKSWLESFLLDTYCRPPRGGRGLK